MAVYYFTMHYVFKIAFLTFYLRLSTNRKFYLWIGVGFDLNTGSLLINILIIVFQCKLISAALSTMARVTANCMDRDFVFVAPGVLNVLDAIFVFIFPIPILWRLRIPRGQKVAVISVFLFGGAAVLMGIIHFHSFIAINSRFSTSRSVGEAMIIAVLELNLAPIASNLPAVQSIWFKKSNDRKTEALSKVQYGGKKANTTQGLNTGRLRQTHEMSRISNVAGDSPLSGSQEELWRNISYENGNKANVPCRQKNIVIGHEDLTDIDLA